MQSIKITAWVHKPYIISTPQKTIQLNQYHITITKERSLTETLLTKLDQPTLQPTCYYILSFIRPMHFWLYKLKTTQDLPHWRYQETNPDRPSNWGQEIPKENKMETSLTYSKPTKMTPQNSICTTRMDHVSHPPMNICRLAAAQHSPKYPV